MCIYCQQRPPGGTTTHHYYMLVVVLIKSGSDCSCSNRTSYRSNSSFNTLFVFSLPTHDFIFVERLVPGLVQEQIASPLILLSSQRSSHPPLFSEQLVTSYTKYMHMQILNRSPANLHLSSSSLSKLYHGILAS